ncbi:hypothetical protein NHQ30_010540 [Ciborinia camelliae]|nr:hypothetical protein NHQ30_010540 [Ciborinia camelliae]
MSNQGGGQSARNNMPQSVETTTNAREYGNGNGNGNGSVNVGPPTDTAVPHGPTSTSTSPELDDFGLPLRKKPLDEPVTYDEPERVESDDHLSPVPEDRNVETAGNGRNKVRNAGVASENSEVPHDEEEDGKDDGEDAEEEFKDARSTPLPATPNPEPQEPCETILNNDLPVHGHPTPRESIKEVEPAGEESVVESPEHAKSAEISKSKEDEPARKENLAESTEHAESAETSKSKEDLEKSSGDDNSNSFPTADNRQSRMEPSQGISEWSHQHTALPNPKSPAQEDDGWQTMPAYAPYDIYDDDNRLVAREAHESDEEADAYAGLGGAGRGYTRVQLDEDAQSATSLDENTQYLFKDVQGTGAGEPEDEEQRDALSQMQATKDLLTEGQRIAYVGMTRLILSKMLEQQELLVAAKKGNKKDLQVSSEAMKMWTQKMMVRLYAHMEISTDEQIMIEQLAEHGVVPSDLTGTLMQNARVKNPMAEKSHSSKGSIASSRSARGSITSPRLPRESIQSPRLPQSPSTPNTSWRYEEEEPAAVPPPYEENKGEDLPEVRTPSQLPTTTNIDIDLRWTVLCDLFLTLIADSVYDSRSRTLLEKVGDNMEVSWLEICRFEKRVTDALEMQQAAEKENWNEDDHKENRRKMALKKRYLMMGLATVGGSLVIGLSAGLLAPVIGAGLAAGFTTIGVAGTSGFLAGSAGAAIITTGAATSGGIIAIKAANRRTGAVKTFEYRPLHNNKRVNLIITVSGWMTGKVDDVRLPYSTVDPIMGDIYSVLWEPEMLTSMGDTINILATEVSLNYLNTRYIY